MNIDLLDKNTQMEISFYVVAGTFVGLCIPVILRYSYLASNKIYDKVVKYYNINVDNFKDKLDKLNNSTIEKIEKIVNSSIIKYVDEKNKAEIAKNAAEKAESTKIYNYMMENSSYGNSGIQYASYPHVFSGYKVNNMKPDIPPGDTRQPQSLNFATKYTIIGGSMYQPDVDNVLDKSVPNQSVPNQIITDQFLDKFYESDQLVTDQLVPGQFPEKFYEFYGEPVVTYIVGQNNINLKAKNKHGEINICVEDVIEENEDVIEENEEENEDVIEENEDVIENKNETKAIEVDIESQEPIYKPIENDLGGWLGLKLKLG